MADLMQFDLVSPERSLASFQAASVQIPGSEGDMTAMPDHAPTLTTLRPGILSVSGADGDQDFVVTGGFAEITPAGVTVLAERAMPKDAVTQDDLNAMVSDAAAAAEGASDGALDAANKAQADVAALGAALGLSTAN